MTDDRAIRRPPDLTPEHFISYTPVAEAEIKRLRAAGARALARHEHVQLVLAEAWLGHLDEVYVSENCSPFRGNVGVYVERLVIGAAADIRGFLTASLPVWGPKMHHPRFGGRLHRAVEFIVRGRVEALGGGCEICHVLAPLDLHHLHYRSFGYEVPSDVMRLCRRCHMRRHRVCGYPWNVEWRDSMQWPTA